VTVTWRRSDTGRKTVPRERSLEMYNLEYSEQTLTTDDKVCFTCDLSGTNGRLKRGKLFRVNGSLTDCDWVARRSLTKLMFHTTFVQFSEGFSLC